VSEADPAIAAKQGELRGVLPAGSQLRSYELISVLGRGAFGITYRARDTTLNRDVAIKEYLPTSLALREGGTMVMPLSTELAEEFVWGRKSFLDEARTLATLGRAPAVVRVFDFLEANGTAYIVMELAVGETLDHHIRRDGPLPPPAIEHILDPLLDGLEQVHDVGFLHRDIKPANIILDARGNPTLIDFGAARAALAGRSTAMTAIFTPGYAAGEQFSSAKQGPWTDIYGLSATVYHAITGHPPPSAFDRMLDDSYEPLAKLTPPGYPPGLLIGIDAGLAVRASDRPQAIAGWRAVLSQTSVPATAATLAMVRQSDRDGAATPSTPIPTSTASASRHGVAKWVGLMATALLLAGGGYYLATKPPSVDPVAVAQAQKAQEELVAADAARRKAEDEAARLRADAEARQKADMEAAQRRQIEEETRRKIEAEQAATRQRAEAEQAAARQKAEAEADARRKAEEQARQAAAAEAADRRKAEEDDKKAAETTETGLRLTTLDRQHVQVALTAMGFSTNGNDGVFGPRTRTMIAAWQKARSQPQTGFLTGAQNQALLKEAAPAIARFDDEQKKLEEEKAKDAKRKADELAKAPAVTAPAPTAPKTSANPYDGDYTVTFTQIALFGRSQSIFLRLVNGYGTGAWQIPVCGEVTFKMTVATNGYVDLDVDDVGAFCHRSLTHLVGRIENNRVKFKSQSWANPYEVDLVRRGG
jgi:serine/threonine protein kinase/peptidoglycan hydrolase-like protein with peptidoglycan-binding domain